MGRRALSGRLAVAAAVTVSLGLAAVVTQAVVWRKVAVRVSAPAALIRGTPWECAAGIPSTRIVFTRAHDVAQLLQQLNLSLGPHDAVTPARQEPLWSGALVTVERGVLIHVVDGGQPEDVWTVAATVGSALSAAGARLGTADRVQPEATAPVEPGMNVTVTRIVHDRETWAVPVPFPVVREDDPHLAYGLVDVQQFGSPGVRSELVDVQRRNGVVTAYQVLKEVATRPPVPQVEAVGTAHVAIVDGLTLHFARALQMMATAYYSGPPSNGITATGVRARRGIVAVDPRVIPLGSEVYVPGYGYGLAADTGGAIIGNRIDLCYDHLQEAFDWGRRWVIVYVLKWG